MSRSTILTPDKDLRKLLKHLRKQGFQVERSGRGHIRIRSPHGSSYVTSCTASDYRARKNLVAAMRRMGARL